MNKPVRNEALGYAHGDPLLTSVTDIGIELGISKQAVSKALKKALVHANQIATERGYLLDECLSELSDPYGANHLGFRNLDWDLIVESDESEGPFIG